MVYFFSNYPEIISLFFSFRSFTSTSGISLFFLKGNNKGNLLSGRSFLMYNPMQYPMQQNTMQYLPPSYPAPGATQYIPDCYYINTILQYQAETERLKRQLEEKTLKEEAMNQILKMQGNTYCTLTKSGRLVPLTNFTFASVEELIYDPFYQRKRQLWIKTSIQEAPALIDLDDFLNDNKWICFLEATSRTSIKLYGSMKRVATLLRSIANTSKKQRFIPYFGGWVKTDRCHLYYTFPGFRTTAKRMTPELYETAHTAIPANIRTSAQRFQSRLEPIQDKPLRSFLAIWLHMSFLQSLLLEYGICLTKIPVITTENPAVQAYLRSALTISPDGIISMNVLPADFTRALLSHKDQPCVILSPVFGKNSVENGRILDEVISSGLVSQKKGTQILDQRPLGTLPILLVDRAASPASSSYGIPISATDDQFDLLSCAATAAEAPCPSDYWSGFLSFTYLHMDELHHLLQKQMAEALAFSTEYQYSAEHAVVLGAMWAVAEFLHMFAQEFSFSDDVLLVNDWLDYAIRLLEESDAQYAAPDGLADCFLAAVRLAICQRGLPCYRMTQQLSSIPRGAVYFDDTYVCLDKIAFDHVCQTAGCPSSAVKRELMELGYFSGKAVNSQAYETRISLLCKQSGRKLIRVYKFRRDLFERLGEPSLFQRV